MECINCKNELHECMECEYESCQNVECELLGYHQKKIKEMILIFKKDMTSIQLSCALNDCAVDIDFLELS